MLRSCMGKVSDGSSFSLLIAMKNIYVLILTLWLIPVFHLQSQVVLYPPLNLQATHVEVLIYMAWNKPQTPSGSTPDGLLGYRIYRNGVFLHAINGPDTLYFYDYPDPGELKYFVTA